ncbi:hypothetical protein QTG96_12440 [Clostridium perfringens]|nr:hypothetical protein [Clostridium perfringens]
MRIFRKRSIETRINDVVIREVEVDETKNGYLNILEIMECPEESYFEEENVIEDDYQEEV